MIDAGGERPLRAAPVEHQSHLVASRWAVAAHMASASAIAGTRSGRTKLAISKSWTPAATSASAITKFASTEIGASSCKPSRRLTSRRHVGWESADHITSISGPVAARGMADLNTTRRLMNATSSSARIELHRDRLSVAVGRGAATTAAWLQRIRSRRRTALPSASVCNPPQRPPDTGTSNAVRSRCRPSGMEPATRVRSASRNLGNRTQLRRRISVAGAPASSVGAPASSLGEMVQEAVLFTSAVTPCGARQSVRRRGPMKVSADSGSSASARSHGVGSGPFVRTSEDGGTHGRE